MNLEQLKARLKALEELRTAGSITETELKEMSDVQAQIKELESDETLAMRKSQFVEATKEAATKAATEATASLQKELDALKAGASRKSILGTGEDEEDEAKAVAQVGKMFRAMRTGDSKALDEVQSEIASDLQARGMSEGTDADGGYLVPVEFARRIERVSQEYGVARKLCRIMPMSTNKKDVPTSLANPTVALYGEGAAITDSKPTFGKVQLVAKKFGAIVVGTQELIEDNATDQAIWDFIADLLGEQFGVAEDEQVFTGDGTGNNLTGILVSSNAQLNTVTMATGDTTFADITADYLLDMVNAVASSARRKGVFVMHPEIFAYVQKLKDSNGQYIYRQPNATETDSDIAGYVWNKPVYLSDAMPAAADTAVSTKFAIFGDLKKGCIIGDRRRITLKRLTEGTIGSTNLAEEDEEALRATSRMAFQVVLGDAIALLKTAAS